MNIELQKDNERKTEEKMQSDFESCYTCANFMKQNNIECSGCLDFENWTISHNIPFMD